MGNVSHIKKCFLDHQQLLLTKIESPISKDDQSHWELSLNLKEFRKVSHLPSLGHFLALFYYIPHFLRAFHSRIKSWRWMALIRFHDTFLSWLWLSLLNLLNQWNMASFIGDFLFSREAAAKCNREVGSQIENLRVVIAIADERFILLDSFHRSAYYHL